MKKVLSLRQQLSMQHSHVAGDLGRKALNSWDVTSIDTTQLVREAGKLDGMIEMLEVTLDEAGISPEDVRALIERANEEALAA